MLHKVLKEAEAARVDPNCQEVRRARAALDEAARRRGAPSTWKRVLGRVWPRVRFARAAELGTLQEDLAVALQRARVLGAAPEQCGSAPPLLLRGAGAPAAEKPVESGCISSCPTVPTKSSLRSPKTNTPTAEVLPPQAPDQLAVMTLNLQCFASYPKDENAAERRLREVTGGSCPPDVICVQEGACGRDVLGGVGFELCVCSGREDAAQPLREMVYDDAPTLKVFDLELHDKLLCNQIYMRKGSQWAVVDSGVVRISSDSSLVGGHGRAQGKLAIRTMVWVKLEGPAPNPCMYVMCTHITGGRFEDQYYVQDLAMERRHQTDRVMDWFEHRRPGPGPGDVGLIVGDFNATPTYTPNGPMHSYFKAGIEKSPGVQADAEAIGVDSPEELERLFAAYMVSPLTAITDRGWSFVYDEARVGISSSFGHLVDHMAASRPIRAPYAEVHYLTNQRFGGGPRDTELPLTDHNAVTVLFSLAPPAGEADAPDGSDPSHWGVARAELEELWAEVGGDLVGYCRDHRLSRDLQGHVCRSRVCSYDHVGAKVVPESEGGAGSYELTANMHTVVDRYIKPRTKGIGSYARMLSERPGRGFRRITKFVSHCWNELFHDFVKAIAHATAEGDVLWICSFALDQNAEAGAHNCGRHVEEWPFARALEAAEQVLLVTGRGLGPLRRSWCAFELLLAQRACKEIAIAAAEATDELLAATAAKALPIDFRSSSASVASDKELILRAVGTDVDAADAAVRAGVAEAARRGRAARGKRNEDMLNNPKVGNRCC